MLNTQEAALDRGDSCSQMLVNILSALVFNSLISAISLITTFVRPAGGLRALAELDVVGLNFKTQTAYLCEVTTHIRGLLYVNNKESVTRIAAKHERQKAYAAKYLSNFKNHHFQFWSPVVPVGYLTANLAQISGLELIINGEYKKRVRQLQERAKKETHDARNPVFRVLQILEHLRD